MSCPTRCANTPDPIEVFTYSAAVSDEMAACVENEMADLEVAAVATAEPSPYVHEVIASALVGGSFADIEAARSAKVASIGYTNKPDKRERTIQLQAGAVITSMADLALSLRAYPANSEL